jgi:2-polyprenyl-3-methyl-5-hydroxy-6-metoxy-1,4-benzoquinol methylase
MCKLTEGFEAEYTRPVDLKKLAFFDRHLAPLRPCSILELGSGHGLIIQNLRDCDAVGVEIDESEAAIARANGLDVRVGHAGRYDAGRKFDVVIASEVIEHMREPQSLLDNAARHLRSGGVLLLTTPNGYGYYELSKRHLNLKYQIRSNNVLRRLLLGKKPYKRGDSFDHCQWFTMRQLLRMTRKAGFSLIDQENSDFITGSERDLQLASKLPYWLVSGWYFAFRFEA